MRHNAWMSVYIELLLVVAVQIGAQPARPAVIVGTVTDSIHRRPLAKVLVSAMRLNALPETTFTTVADGRGRFRFDNLPGGRYALTFANAFLDSIEYGGPARQATANEGKTTRVDLGIPSGKTLRALACPGTSLPRRTGVLQGIIVDAESERRLANADVVLAWSGLIDANAAVRKAAMRDNALAPRFVRVTTDSAGGYRLCGVPTGDAVMMQVQHRGLAGAPIQISIEDASGVTVRNLSFSPVGARSLIESSAIPSAGTASLTGVVRGSDGAAIPRAEVSVLHSDSTTLSDERGEFVIRGLPAGTQEVEARQIGFGVTRQLVELRSGRTVRHEFQLQRVAVLDSILSLAARFREFEHHREHALQGQFLDAAAIDSMRPHVSNVSDIIARMPGWSLPDRRVVGQGSAAHVPRCKVIVDGFPEPDVGDRTLSPQGYEQDKGGMLNGLHLYEVAAIELYRNRFSAPMQYDLKDGQCLIMIWSKR